MHFLDRPIYQHKTSISSLRVLLECWYWLRFDGRDDMEQCTVIIFLSHNWIITKKKSFFKPYLNVISSFILHFIWLVITTILSWLMMLPLTKGWYWWCCLWRLSNNHLSAWSWYGLAASCIINGAKMSKYMIIELS